MNAKGHATGGQMAKGAAWLMGFKMLDKSIGAVSVLVLARVLTPADYGLVAMATAVLAMLELMGAFGFDAALIQRQQIDRLHFDTAWTFNVIFGTCVAVLLLVLAVPAADFYRESRLRLMLPALALGALVSGFENIGTVMFRKDLDFRTEFNFLLGKRLAGFTVTVTLALTYRSFWALVAGIVSSKVMAVLISYRLHPYRPRLTLAARADLLQFSKWLFISNLIQFLHSRSTDFALGRTVGSHGLGVYNVAAEIATMPSTDLVAPLNRAIYPAYTRLSSEREKLWERFFQVYGLICLFAFPVSIGMYCLSDLLVSVLLGAQWMEAVPIMKIFGVCGLVGALQGNLYLVILALGQPKANTLLSASILALSLPAVVYGSVHWGAVGAAYAHLGSALIGFGGILVVFKRVTGLTPGRLLGRMWRPLCSSLAMAAALSAAADALDSTGIAFAMGARLTLLILAGAVSYLLIAFGLWRLAGSPVAGERIVLHWIEERLFTLRASFAGR